MIISLFRGFWQQLKASLFEQVRTTLLISSDLLQAVITDLLFPVFNRIDQGRLISLLQACKRQYSTGLFEQLCYSLTKWTGLLLYVNSLCRLGKINSLQQVCDISGRVRILKYKSINFVFFVWFWGYIYQYTRKNLTTCNKSANKPSTSCVRTACYNLSTSLEQIVNNL